MEFMKKQLLVFVIWFLIQGTGFAAVQQEDLQEIFRQSYQLESEGEYFAALNVMKTVYDEDVYEINLRLGWLAYLSGHLNESVSYYNRAIQLKSFSIEPKLGITYPLSSMGNWDALVAQYKDILGIAPANTTALYNLGLIYYNRRDYELAEQNFKKLVNLFPFDYDGLLMLGWSSFQMKKYREAQVLFQKALLNDPSSESAKEGLQLMD